MARSAYDTQAEIILERNGRGMVVIRLFGILVLCLTQTGFASGQSTDPIQELMVVSGLDEQIRQMWDALRTDLAKWRQRAPAGNVQMLEQLEQELTLTIKTDAIRAKISGRLKDELAPAEIATLLEFFRSPFGKQIGQLQRSAWTIERLEPKEPPGKPQPGAEQIDSLRRLGVETHTLRVYLAWSLCRVPEPLLLRLPPSEPVPPPGTRAFETGVDEIVRMSERSLREIDLKLFLGSPLYAFVEVLYRPLTGDSLEKYLDFAQSSAGSKFYRISGTMIERSFFAACMEAGYRLREHITGGSISGHTGGTPGGTLSPAYAAYQAGDYATALRIWTPLAEQGVPEAQNMLGVMSEWGRGMPRDYQTALHWYRKAAAQGNSAALSNLSGMYQYGKGVTQDYVRAYMWKSLELSSPSFMHPHDSLERKVATVDLEEIARHLTSQEMKEARALAEACRDTQYQRCD